MPEEPNPEMPAPPPPLPPAAMQQMMQSPAVTFAEAKQLLKQVKSELKLARRNAEPTTKWWRPAHGKNFCQYCPAGVETPLTVDHSSGLYREACAQHQFLIDHILSARSRVRKFETMIKRIKNQEIVPRAELTQTYDTEFTPEERAHLRETGWIHREEVVSGLQKLLKDLQLQGEQ